MENFIFKLLEMSASASCLIPVVLIIRWILKKAPKSVAYMLWALVGVRLLCPISFESVWSALPNVSSLIKEVETPEFQTESIGKSYNVEGQIWMIDSEAMERLAYGLTCVWCVGLLLMICYVAVGYKKVYRNVQESMVLKENIYLCDHIATPFILGIFRPRIYIPSTIDEEQLEYVIAHEQSHLKRRDHWWKPLGFLVLSIHWFNPFVWIAYILLCRDIELACDERVIKTKDADYKKAYAKTLLECSVSRKMISVYPLAFGEVGVKTRVKSVLGYRKPALWIGIVAVISCVITALCFLTNPLNVSASYELDAFITDAIYEHHKTENSANYISMENHEILAIKEKGNETVVYAMVLYQEYSYVGGQVQEESGAYTPTVITVENNEGEYLLKEYWVPRDGTYYAGDIKEKFQSVKIK